MDNVDNEQWRLQEREFNITDDLNDRIQNDDLSVAQELETGILSLN